MRPYLSLPRECFHAAVLLRFPQHHNWSTSVHAPLCVYPLACDISLAMCPSVESPVCLRSVHHSFQVYLLSLSPPSPQCSSYFPKLILFIINCLSALTSQSSWLAGVFEVEKICNLKKKSFIFHCTGEGRNFEDCFAHSRYILEANMIPGKSRIHSRITWMVTNLEFPKYS